MPPAFVLSQDQTLHKIILTTSVVMIFLKNRLSSISLCNLNYIQINVNCQVTSHYSIFKQLSATIADRLSTSPLRLPNCGVTFNLSQVWDLSNFVFNFFQTFLFQPCRSVYRQPNRGLRFNISQFELLSNLISNFFRFFYQPPLAWACTHRATGL